MPELSIIVPCYNEENSIHIFIDEVNKKLINVCSDYELIFIDDGSSDNTLETIKKIKMEKRQSISIISFSRNFGKEAAMAAGINAAKGEAVTFLDCDLQDPPELLCSMIEKWRKGADVVLAKRVDRSSDSFLKRFFANAFYKIHNMLADVCIYENVGDYKLLDRRAVEALKTIKEKTRFLKGLTSWIGFNVDYVEYKRPERKAGESKFTFWKLWNYAIEGITSFSSIPLRIWTYIGSIITLFAFFRGLYIIAKILIYGVEVPGYASLFVAIMFFGGVQLLTLGIIGEYISRIYIETKDRPLYIVKYEDYNEG